MKIRLEHLETPEGKPRRELATHLVAHLPDNVRPLQQKPCKPQLPMKSVTVLSGTGSARILRCW